MVPFLLFTKSIPELQANQQLQQAQKQKAKVDIKWKIPKRMIEKNWWMLIEK